MKEPEKPAAEATEGTEDGEAPAEGAEAAAKDGEATKKDDKAKVGADKKPEDKKPDEKPSKNSSKTTSGNIWQAHSDNEFEFNFDSTAAAEMFCEEHDETSCKHQYSYHSPSSRSRQRPYW